MENVVNVEDLRAAIWDFLFQEQRAKTIDELATAAELEPAVIRGVVQHGWFQIVEDQVSIAY